MSKKLLVEKDLPEFNEDFVEETFGKRLMNFYEELGWDGESNINPDLVIMNNDDWKKRVEKEREIYENQVAESEEDLKEGDKAIKYLWLNKGPAGLDEIPKGKVRLYKGWQTNNKVNN